MEQTFTVQVAVVVPDDAAGRLDEIANRRNSRERSYLFGLQQPFHRPAVRMTADDDVLDLDAATAN